MLFIGVRKALLDDDEQKCPMEDCDEFDITPDSLVINKFLRVSVEKFSKKTGIGMKKEVEPVKKAELSISPPQNVVTTPVKVSLQTVF